MIHSLGAYRGCSARRRREKAGVVCSHEGRQAGPTAGSLLSEMGAAHAEVLCAVEGT